MDIKEYVIFMLLFGGGKKIWVKMLELEEDYRRNALIIFLVRECHIQPKELEW